jgi:hypothetical protein
VVIQWAKAHRDDPRVPEALHLAVEATHYGADTPLHQMVEATHHGSDTAGASAYSKEAFQLLHRNYPHSPWTAKTKYY